MYKGNKVDATNLLEISYLEEDIRILDKIMTEKREERLELLAERIRIKEGQSIRIEYSDGEVIEEKISSLRISKSYCDLDYEHDCLLVYINDMYFEYYSDIGFKKVMISAK